MVQRRHERVSVAQQHLIASSVYSPYLLHRHASSMGDNFPC